jgi:hypothetical protein
MKTFTSFKQYLNEEKSTVYFTFGRMNPPTIGHEKLLDKLSSTAGRNPYKVFLSQSQDAKKNPLSYNDKVKHARKMFPKHARSIMLDKKVKTVFDALVSMYQGVTNVAMVVGSDRVTEFETLINKYNGDKGRHGFYNFQSIKVISAGNRDPDADDVSGMSASKQRANAANNDFVAFAQGLPKTLTNADAKKLFNDVRSAMGLSERKQFKNHIELESVSETREKYVTGELYTIGDVVRIKENNQLATISWLGTNYVCVDTGDGQLKRKWLDDVVLEQQDPIDKAKQLIDKEKQSDAAKHDKMLDRARIRKAINKNKATQAYVK